jgi:hypothetical protein
MRIIPFIAIVGALTACSPAPASEPAPASAPAAPETPAADATPQTPPAVVEAPIVGGYAPADLADETVKAAQVVATDAIYTRNPTRALVEKVEVEQQVVAGMNYRFTITMSGGAKYGVTVYRDLDGKMEVTDYAKLP